MVAKLTENEPIHFLFYNKNLKNGDNIYESTNFVD